VTRRFNDAEIQQRMGDLYQSGLTYREVALEIGCSPSQAGHYIAAMGISRSQGRFNDAEIQQRMGDLYQSGLSSREVALEIGCSQGSVLHYIVAMGISPRPPGSRSGHRVPTAEEMLDNVLIDSITGCHRYQGRLDKTGYAPGLGHRKIYEFLVGPIPDGYEIDHVYARGCRHLDCIWIEHLEPVTPNENKRRIFQARGYEGRCPHGQERKRDCTPCRKDRQWYLGTKAWAEARSVILRDQPSCAICGDEIDFGAKPRSRLAPSVDHIISPALVRHLPVEEQLIYAYDLKNLRPAHVRCNSIMLKEALDPILLIGWSSLVEQYLQEHRYGR
jgi:5-methylcytosine-specific restriction endonuclease McrA